MLLLNLCPMLLSSFCTQKDVSGALAFNAPLKSSMFGSSFQCSAQVFNVWFKPQCSAQAFNGLLKPSMLSSSLHWSVHSAVDCFFSPSCTCNSKKPLTLPTKFLMNIFKQILISHLIINFTLRNIIQSFVNTIMDYIMHERNSLLTHVCLFIKATSYTALNT